jgi:Cdc6-like AAA superfamily ATPase
MLVTKFHTHTGKISVIYILIFRFLDSKLEDEGLHIQNNVSWLTQGYVYHRFVHCLDEINLLFTNDKSLFQEVCYHVNLQALTDFWLHLNYFSLYHRNGPQGGF